MGSLAVLRLDQLHLVAGRFCRTLLSLSLSQLAARRSKRLSH